MEVIRLAGRYRKQDCQSGHQLGSVQSAEKRITEIAALRKHIFNYSNTRANYEAYRKAGYSRKFYEAHWEEITIHKAAKKAFDEFGMKRIQRVKDLNAEYARLMAEKKKMKLIVNGSKNRNVKIADPNTGEFLWCPNRLFFHFSEMYL